MRQLTVALVVVLAASACRKSVNEAAASPAPVEPPSAAPAEPVGGPSPVPSAPTPLPAEMAALAGGLNEFALALLPVSAPDGKNAFLSPLSISTALAMTWAGARGETSAQMKATLHFDLQPDKLHETYGALLTALDSQDATRGYTVRIANRLWAARDGKFEEAFLRLTRERYRAPAELVNFKDPEPARQLINGWVEQQTENRIKELLVEGIITPETALVLTNAIYFKGLWDAQFKPEASQPASFTTASGTAREVTLMRQTRKFRYAQTDAAQWLELPYRGDELSMVIVLPREADGLAAVEQSLSAATLANQLAAMRPETVVVEIPRFRMESAFELKPALTQLGMPLAFTSVADFSGMTGSRGLWISAVIHKAFVEVNEEGSEAAAATAVVMSRSKSVRETVAFRADHPFLFFIRDVRSGSILFLGRLADPG